MTQLFGAAFGGFIHETVSQEVPALAEAATGSGNFMWMTHERTKPAKAEAFVEALPEAGRSAVPGVYQEASPPGRAQRRAGRDVLLYSVCLPALLFVEFGLIALYFRSRGGYRPVELALEAG